MNNIPAEVLSWFVQACHRAAAMGLISCSSGNFSYRLDEERILVTSSRCWLADVRPEQVCVCRLSDGSVLAGGKPTVEVGFHMGVLRTRPEMNVVLHFHSPCATTLACQQPKPVNYFVIPEIPFYIGPVARIPYLCPGSPELARAVTEALGDHNMVMITNHGQVTVAEDFDHAIQNAKLFELACEIILHGGASVTPIPEAEVNKLLSLKHGP